MQAEHVAVSRLLGASALRALAVDVVRNIVGPVLVLATLGVGTAILLLAGLGFNFLGDGLRDAFDPRSVSDETLAPGRALDGPG
jgi:ABC-type dipeptide/oligopeptide/nickel transport system permease subunit